MFGIVISAITVFFANAVSLVAGISSALSQGVQKAWGAGKNHVANTRENYLTAKNVLAGLSLACGVLSVVFALLTFCNQRKS